MASLKKNFHSMMIVSDHEVSEILKESKCIEETQD